MLFRIAAFAFMALAFAQDARTRMTGAGMLATVCSICFMNESCYPKSVVEVRCGRLFVSGCASLVKEHLIQRLRVSAFIGSCEQYLCDT